MLKSYSAVLNLFIIQPYIKISNLYPVKHSNTLNQPYVQLIKKCPEDVGFISQPFSMNNPYSYEVNYTNQHRIPYWSVCEGNR